MVFNVGIDGSAEKIKVAAYSDIMKENFKFKSGQSYVKNIKKVNEFYKNIKAKLIGDASQDNLGYACIFMKDDIDFDIRKEFVKKGKENGFKNVLIINSIIKTYLDCILSLKEKPKNGDIFWIFDEECCSIWEKTDTKGKLIKIFQHKYHSITAKFLLEMKEESGIGKDPNLIILDLKYYENFFKILENVFSDCNCIIHENNLNICDICLIKARIMADDEILYSDIKMCDVDNYICETAEIWIGSWPYNDGEKILISEKGQLLPLKKTLIMPLKNDAIITDANKLKTITFWIGNRWSVEKINLTPEMLIIGEIFLILKIDENCIPFFNYSETVEQRIKILYAKQILAETTYKIPKKELINNPNANAIGIDLGMTRCCVAVNRKDRFELVAIDYTEKQLPSYISFKEKEPICGQLVINQLQFYANSTVFDTKRLIGRNFDETEINPAWPFGIVKGDNNKPMIRVQGYEGTVEKYPEDISAILLKHMKQKVEEFQGTEMDEVVITVPAGFNKDQKIATHVAAELAGFKTVHLLGEPIAASIAYFVDRPIPSNFNMLLFDLGGGTLDLCIFKVEKNKLKIVTTDGDCNLGGRNFDDILFEHFARILETSYDITITQKNKFRLIQKCQEIKHTLSTEDEASLDIGDFNLEIDEFINITRQEFEKLSAPLLVRIHEVLKQTFSKTNIFASDINKVLLVGGGCRMPMIQHFLHQMFTVADHTCDKNPDEMVAIGAAYYSSFLMSKKDSTGCIIM